MSIRTKVKRWFFQDMPEVATGLEWHDWKVQAKKNKIRWFIAETVPLWFQVKIVMPIEDRYYRFRARFIDKYWNIEINTLDKSGYHDYDSRLLHGMFQLLTDYVEERSWYGDESLTPRERALAHLDWEIGLSDPNSSKMDELLRDRPEYHIGGDKYHETQSYAAGEIKVLYLWWHDDRPNRIDYHDVVGESGYSWSSYCDSREDMFDAEGNKYDGLARMDVKSDEEHELTSKILSESDEVKQQYDEEDEQMLIRLIKVRKRLWR